MPFHTNRSTRHATSDRRIVERLDQHKKLMDKYQGEGMTREQASAKAYDDLTRMTPEQVEQFNREVDIASRCNGRR